MSFTILSTILSAMLSTILSAMSSTLLSAMSSTLLSTMLSAMFQVRWADLEEKRLQDRDRQLGFVVGHTNWNRIVDDDYANKQMNQTKFFQLSHGMKKIFISLDNCNEYFYFYRIFWSVMQVGLICFCIKCFQHYQFYLKFMFSFFMKIRQTFLGLLIEMPIINHNSHKVSSIIW